MSLGGTLDAPYKPKMYKTCECGTPSHVPIDAKLDSGSFYNSLHYDTLSCSGKCGRFWVWST